MQQDGQYTADEKSAVFDCTDTDEKFLEEQKFEIELYLRIKFATESSDFL